jgi:DNA-binding MarR family transcriptional regulator
VSSHQDNHEARTQEILQEFQGLFEAIAPKIKHKMQYFHTDFQLASGQVFVMMMLHKQGICKATDIANHLGVTSGAVTGLTDKLVNLGLMSRIRSEEDRRVVQFTLTDKGVDVLKQIRQERLQMLFGLFEKLEIDDLEKMLDVFTKLNNVLE